MTEPQSKTFMEDMVYITPLEAHDVPFVMRSWICGMRRNTDNIFLPSADYYKFARHTVTSLLDHPTTHVRVLRLREDDTSICAFVVFHAECLYWLYVKHAFRGFGLSKILGDCANDTSKELGCTGLKYSAFRTEHGIEPMVHLRKNVFFVPTLFIGKKENQSHD